MSIADGPYCFEVSLAKLFHRLDTVQENYQQKYDGIVHPFDGQYCMVFQWYHIQSKIHAETHLWLHDI